jgi:ribosome-associated protein
MPVPMREIQLTFARSQGPGGQNVNKVSSKAQLRWDIWSSEAYSSDEKIRLTRELAPYLTWKNEVVLQSDETRSQLQNKERVIRKLNQLVEKALTPVKLRVPTKPSRGAKERRIENKKLHGQKKKRRSVIDFLFFF